MPWRVPGFASRDGLLPAVNAGPISGYPRVQRAPPLRCAASARSRWAWGETGSIERDEVLNG
jgi:hypothetical protein